ncbi:MAG TPA: acetolactate synthase small subunit [bacterium]|jgi:acetolactate synthase-1/3 small subunit|nr:acetolactate synthase small subunit [Dictyoglomota bacterium]HHV80515.1 acetolactate synthase small subunit [bacterium]HOK29629.1 acetolactate synthase small subunit [bacterium]HOL55048.1 acetolactate synthase small subunit [bacterium]HON72700.1 acetolactate synthase small subunit [bacterium]
MRHTIAVLVENKSGVLARVSNLFRRRGYNIESITVGKSEREGIARITLEVDGDELAIEQVTKQLNKLIEVIKVSDITHDEMIERELMLIKVSADTSTRSEILQIVDIFRAGVVDVSPKALVIEITGDRDKLDAFEALLRPFGIKEIACTGKVAMVRHPKEIK